MMAPEPYANLAVAEDAAEELLEVEQGLGEGETEWPAQQPFTASRRWLAALPMTVVLLGSGALLWSNRRSSSDEDVFKPSSLQALWSLVPRRPMPRGQETFGLQMTCDADIVVQTDLGSVRVPSADYNSGGVVPLFNISLSTTYSARPCATTYSAVCIEGKAIIQSQ